MLIYKNLSKVQLMRVINRQLNLRLIKNTKTILSDKVKLAWRNQQYSSIVWMIIFTTLSVLVPNKLVMFNLFKKIMQGLSQIKLWILKNQDTIKKKDKDFSTKTGIIWFLIRTTSYKNKVPTVICLTLLRVIESNHFSRTKLNHLEIIAEYEHLTNDKLA